MNVTVVLVACTIARTNLRPLTFPTGLVKFNSVYTVSAPLWIPADEGADVLELSLPCPIKYFLPTTAVNDCVPVFVILVNVNDLRASSISVRINNPTK